MWSFVLGVALALVLAVGSFGLFGLANVTSVERNSPRAWVRVDDARSLTAEGTGYGDGTDHADTTDR